MEEKGHIKNNTFKTPENYFNNFNNEIKIRIIEEQLKDKFGNENPFSVPKDYFQTFSVELKKETQRKARVIQILKPYISIAAGIIIIFGIWQIIFSNIDKINTVAEINDTTMIENNINFDDIEFDDLNENIDKYLDGEDIIAVINYEEEPEQEIDVNVDEDEISEYLIDYIDEADFEEILASL